MSIELSSAPASPKAIAGAEKTIAKGNVKSGDKADASAECGFAAIMTSLEPAAEKHPDVDTSITSQDALQLAVSPDLVAALVPSMPSELSLMLAQAGAVISDKFNSGGTAVADSVVSTESLVGNMPRELGMLQAQAGVVVDDKLKGGDIVLSGNVVSTESLGSSVRSGLKQARNAVQADKSEPSKGKFIVPAFEKTENIPQSANALLDQMAQALPGLGLKAHGVDSKSGTAANLAELKLLAQVSLADLAVREPVLSSVILANGFGEGLMRQADRTTNKTSTQPAGLGVEGIWGQSVFQTGKRVEVPSVAIDPTTQPIETTVAETVSYWATHGVQNAELKIDGAGGESIAVSISLRGDEAHIGFRTDQLETRQMLEGAVAHLKELLTSEGLVLSGVSVGASGQDKAGAQDQRNQPGARQATLVSTETAPVENIPRASKAVTRALDLYV